MSSYFDYAAATPVSDSVLEAMQLYWQDQFYNPGALYLAAQEVKTRVAQARSIIAQLLGVQPPTITFTPGVTEANNFILASMAQSFPGKEVIISAFEHQAVTTPAEALAARGLLKLKLAPVNANGQVDLPQLARAISSDTVLISIIHAHNELGVVQNLKKVVELRDLALEDRRQNGNQTPLFVHSDAAQSPNYLDININQLKVDALSLSGAKVYGPKQTGLLYARSHITLVPLVYGGGHERGLRGGTENVAGIVGLARALQDSHSRREVEAKRLHALRAQLETGLMGIEGARINCQASLRLPNITSLTLAGRDAERLVMELDEKGFQVATGAACSASDHTPSTSLQAIGLNDQQAQSTLRISMGRQTAEKDTKALLAAIKQVLN